MNRFDYVKYNETTMIVQDEFKKLFQDVERLLNLLPEGRGKSLAFTHLEESYMWVGKSLRDNQIRINGSAELQEERKNG